MCSHPSKRKQEDKCCKVEWSLINRTFNFQQDFSKVVLFFFKAKHFCWYADVSTANGDWLVGQLLPYHVTSSRSFLCCSVRCSMCSHSSPSHTQAFGKLLILLQEDRYWKVVWFLPNRTAPLIFSKTLLKSSDFFTANDFTQARLHLVIVAQLSQNEKSGYWDPKGWEGSVRKLRLNSQVMALQLMDNLPLRQNLCMRHLILRSAFLGVVHFDQEVVSFNAKQRWNMVKMSCAMSDSHSSAEIDCYQLTLPLCFKHLQTLVTWLANRVGSGNEVETWAWSRQSAVGRWLAPLKHSFLDGLPDLSGHCLFTTMCVLRGVEGLLKVWCFRCFDI